MIARWQAPIAAMAMLIAVPLAAKPATPYTPAVGSAERTAVIRALRWHPDARFTFRHLRIWHSGDRAIAYAEGDNGLIGGFKIILTRDGKSGWREVWAEGDGGSDSCVAGARHYGWALKLIQTYQIAPDALVPGITKQTAALDRMATKDPELQCVGDLSGGPT